MACGAEFCGFGVLGLRVGGVVRMCWGEIAVGHGLSVEAVRRLPAWCSSGRNPVVVVVRLGGVWLLRCEGQAQALELGGVCLTQ